MSKATLRSEATLKAMVGSQNDRGRAYGSFRNGVEALVAFNLPAEAMRKELQELLNTLHREHAEAKRRADARFSQIEGTARFPDEDAE